MNRFVIGLLLAGLVVSPGCTAGGSQLPQDTQSQQTQLAADAQMQFSNGLELPSLATLLQRETSSPPVDGERWRSGSINEAALGSSHFSGDTYSPNHAAGDPLANAAWAIYRFGNFSEYEGDGKVKLFWDNPAVFADYYVGISDFSSGHWNWWKQEPQGAGPSGLQGYASPAGNVYVAVLLLGSTPASLDVVRIGAPVPPYAGFIHDLNVNENLNFGPLLVHFDAGGCLPIGTNMASYDWDFESDGTFDLVGESQPLAEHTYPPGNFICTLRAFDDEGAFALWSHEFAILDPNNQKPVAKISASEMSGPAPLALQVDGLQSSDPDGYIALYQYDIDSDGTYEIESDSPQPVDVLLAEYGANSITLRVTDNFFAKDTDTIEIDLTTGWWHSTVHSDVNIWAPISMIACGEDPNDFPAVLYYDSKSGKLLFRRASNSLGVNWGPAYEPSPFEGRFDSYNVPDMVYSPELQAPIACYSVWDDIGKKYRLYSVTANSYTGASWAAPVLVDPGVDMGRFNSICMLNGKPAIASVLNPAQLNGGQARFCRSLDDAGGLWDCTAVSGPASNYNFQTDIMALPQEGLDLPFLCWTEQESDAIHVYGRLAMDATGTNWNPQVEVSASGGEEIELAVVNSNPAVVCSSSFYQNKMSYSRASDPSGGQWQQPPEIFDCYGSVAGLAIWDGRPCIAYYDRTRASLYMQCATDADGTSWEDRIPVDTEGDTGSNCAFIVSDNRPVLVYMDKTNGKLVSSYWYE